MDVVNRVAELVGYAVVRGSAVVVSLKFTILFGSLRLPEPGAASLATLPPTPATPP
jgi:hypothetical protein